MFMADLRSAPQGISASVSNSKNNESAQSSPRTFLIHSVLTIRHIFSIAVAIFLQYSFSKTFV